MTQATPVPSRLPGKVVWRDLMTCNPQKAEAFYQELFGWSFQSVKNAGVPYQISRRSEEETLGHAGMVALDPEAAHGAHWIGYLSVDDVDASCQNLVAAGGRLISDPADIPGIGRFAVVTDEQGAFFNVFRHEKSDMPDTDIDLGGFLWDELWTRDVESAEKFYTEAFGFEAGNTAASEEPPYIALQMGGHLRGGIMKAPLDRSPPHWLPYIRVEDVDSIVEKACGLGARVLLQPSVMPGVGRFAVLKDAVGAPIGILAPGTGEAEEPAAESVGESASVEDVETAQAAPDVASSAGPEEVQQVEAPVEEKASATPEEAPQNVETTDEV